MTAGASLLRRACLWPGAPLVAGAWFMAGGVIGIAAADGLVVVRQAPAAVRPVLECVAPNPSGGYTAHFGYVNEGTTAVSVPVGDRNGVSPGSANRGQPTSFAPGRTPRFPRAAFPLDFDGRDLRWTITGPDGRTRTATASASSRRCTSLVDTVAPRLSFAEPSAGAFLATRTPRIRLAFDDGAVDLSSLRVSLDGVDRTPWFSVGPRVAEAVPAPLDEGRHRLEASARDDVGRTVSASLSFTVDTTAPQVTVLQPAEGSVLSAPAVDVGGGVADGALVRVTVAGVEAVVRDGSFRAVGVPLGEGPEATLAVVARDAAGNTSSSAVHLRVERRPPSVRIQSPATGTRVGGAVVRVRGTVRGAGEAPVVVDVNGRPALVEGEAFEADVPVSTMAGELTLRATAWSVGGLTATDTVDCRRRLARPGARRRGPAARRGAPRVERSRVRPRRRPGGDRPRERSARGGEGRRLRGECPPARRRPAEDPRGGRGRGGQPARGRGPGAGRSHAALAEPARRRGRLLRRPAGGVGFRDRRRRGGDERHGGWRPGREAGPRLAGRSHWPRAGPPRRRRRGTRRGRQRDSRQASGHGARSGGAHGGRGLARSPGAQRADAGHPAGLGRSSRGGPGGRRRRSRRRAGPGRRDRPADRRGDGRPVTGRADRDDRRRRALQLRRGAGAGPRVGPKGRDDHRRAHGERAERGGRRRPGRAPDAAGRGRLDRRNRRYASSRSPAAAARIRGRGAAAVAGPPGRDRPARCAGWRPGVPPDDALGPGSARPPPARLQPRRGLLPGHSGAALTRCREGGASPGPPRPPGDIRRRPSRVDARCLGTSAGGGCSGVRRPRARDVGARGRRPR